MSKAGRIVFWISFPLISLIVSLLLVYIDLSNGPIIILILEAAALTAAITVRILLRNKKFYIRGIPTVSLILINFILLPLSQPGVRAKSAAYYENPAKTEQLRLENGLVQGVLSKDKNVEIYAGIPYAEAPTGEYRWKEPRDKNDWEGVLDCSYFGPRAMQNDGNQIVNSLVDIYAQKAYYPDFREKYREPVSEDCLSLTMWRPANTKADDKLPILVYIHGGSLTTGSCTYEDYNGEEVAKTGIIMINIQYRLGVFGYFAHPDLAKESPNGTTGNYGLLDQIKALEWVNKNAKDFGGDKDNITIAGESAGSSSVSAICSSPLAKGLFRRAIGESSSVVVKTPPHTYRKMEEAQKTGQKIMEEMQCSSIEEMRKLSPEKLLKTKYSNSSMTLDGYVLTKDPYDVYLANENNEEALLNGFNVLEADAFVVPSYLFSPTNKTNIHERLVQTFDEEYATKIEALYAEKIEKDAFSAFNEIFSVYWFMHPHYSWTNMAIANGVKVYRYQFTKENGFHGTYHSGEMIYCYGNVRKSSRPQCYNQSDYDLSDRMLKYWTNFVKTGDPNYEDSMQWTPYFPSEGKIMELGTNVGLINDPYMALYKIIDEFIDYRIANPKEAE